MLTIGILSDTHGTIDARILDAVNGCDYIIHAGDICGASVLQQLRPGISLHAVAGNNDHPAAWHADDHHVVKALPKQISLDLPGGRVIIEHGDRLGNSPDHDQFRWDHAEARMIVYGHTHKRVIDQSAEPWVINPGAAGNVRTRGGPSCLILQVSEFEWKIETLLFSDEAAA
jgi:hypothetical protein